ncbi:uncharacterized protein LOC124140844 [Haliotis rufescens]|uniref:uncharacterized protein LOC124140844 n=1 Tax=Haliotis rufescens TaxID=6454 RepID=UPI001EB0107A|nr:uncharacterized protein LOC124140844 [Haliotis rufescens]
MPGLEGTGYVPYVPDEVPISGEYSYIVGGTEMVKSPNKKGEVSRMSEIMISLGGSQSSSMSMLDIERRNAASAIRVANRPSVWDMVGNTLVQCLRAVVGDNNNHSRTYRYQDE